MDLDAIRFQDFVLWNESFDVRIRVDQINMVVGGHYDFKRFRQYVVFCQGSERFFTDTSHLLDLISPNESLLIDNGHSLIEDKSTDIWKRIEYLPLSLLLFHFTGIHDTKILRTHQAVMQIILTLLVGYL